MGSSTDLRIYEHPDFPFHRGEAMTLNFEGDPVSAYASETVAVALCAAGLKTFSRSMKFHRPRGVFSLLSIDGNSLLRIDGESNQPSTRIFCKNGMRIERDGGFPSASFDMLRLTDSVFRKKFDYHGMFTGSKFMNRQFKAAVRMVSGLGDLPDVIPAREPKLSVIKTPLLIVGAGPAGIAAALEASEAGLDALLVDSDTKAGGHLQGFLGETQGFENGPTWATRHANLLRESKITYMPETEIIGYFAEGFFVAHSAEGLVKIRADQTILACGAHEHNLLFANNDLPGVMGARSLSMLVARYGIRAAKNVAIAGRGRFALSLAKRLRDFGIEVSCLAVAKQKNEQTDRQIESIEAKGTQVLHGFTIEKASGSDQLSDVRLTGPGSKNSVRAPCGILAVDAPPAPRYELAQQAGVPVNYSKAISAFLPACDAEGRTPVRGIYVAGEIAGRGETENIIHAGRLAAASAACAASSTSSRETRLAELRGNAHA